MQKNKVNWKLGGEAGFGINVAGNMFAKACARGGLSVLTYNEYPSLIRGGHNTSQVRVDAEQIHSQAAEVNILVALNKETVEKHKGELSEDAAIIYDGEEFEIKQSDVKKGNLLCNVPLSKIAEQPLMRNTVALGASIALVDYDFEILASLIKESFARKGDEVIKSNLNAAKAGYEHVKKNYKNFNYTLSKISSKKQMYICGNDAMGLGAIKAGCKFLSAYPMTPASGIMHYFVSKEAEHNVVMKHAEDEIAAINMAIGASFAGARAMTATSGGGFSLMVEALGMAGCIETPLVVVDVQRPGPSTGMPTWSDQGDLRFVLHSSQGDFPRIVFAPGDIDECFFGMVDAFNLAEKYQLPVIVLSDKHLGESFFTNNVFDDKDVKIERGLLLSDKDLLKIKDYNRHMFTKDGISPRAVPSQKNGVFASASYEHDEYGTICESSENRIKMMDKRFKKLDAAAKDIPLPVIYGDKKAELTIIGWGSTKGAILDALNELKKEGINANFMQILYISPFASNYVAEILNKAKNTLIVECNYSGQLAGVIRENTGIEIQNKLLKYDGRPFYAEEIVKKAKEILKK